MIEKLNQDTKVSANSQAPSAWSRILASIAFSFATFVMLHLYGLVHWKIMLDKGKPRDEQLLQPVLQLLGVLGWLRVIFAVLALIWALWSFKGRPRLGAMIAFALAIGAILASMIIM